MAISRRRFVMGRVSDVGVVSRILSVKDVNYSSIKVTITLQASSRRTANVQPVKRTLNGLFNGAVRSITATDPGINPISISLIKLSESSATETMRHFEPKGT
jgi:hypothetical protein